MTDEHRLFAKIHLQEISLYGWRDELWCFAERTTWHPQNPRINFDDFKAVSIALHLVASHRFTSSNSLQHIARLHMKSATKPKKKEDEMSSEERTKEMKIVNAGNWKMQISFFHCTVPEEEKTRRQRELKIACGKAALSYVLPFSHFSPPKKSL